MSDYDMLSGEIGLGDLAIGDLDVGAAFGAAFGADFGADFGATGNLQNLVNAALSGAVDPAEAIGHMAAMGADADTIGEVAAEIGRRRRRARARGGLRIPQLRNALPARQPEPAQRGGAAMLGGFGRVSDVHQYTPPQGVGGRILPLEAAGVAAGASSTINVQPQDTYRPERLVYAGAANTFTISDFRIKNVPQTIAVGNVPADAFAPNAVDQRLNFTPCPVGGQISVLVTNFTGAAATFRGILVGSAAVQI